MIRLWVVAVIIASNGVHLTYKSVDTIHIKINSGSLDDKSLLTLSLHPISRSSRLQSLLHHSTSNLDLNNEKLGYHMQKMSKDSFSILSTFRSLQNNNYDNLFMTNILTYFRCFYLTFVLAFLLLAYHQYLNLRQKHRISENVGKEDEIDSKKKRIYNVNEVASDIEISMYRLLPLRTLSRFWGYINSIELPVMMRKPILNTYIETFGCNIDEAYIEDLTQYKNLGEFFRRSLKPGVRPIDSRNGVVSPADGTVLHFGTASNGKVEQVKGITYSLSTFLGPQTWSKSRSEAHQLDGNILDSNNYQKNLLIKNTKKNKTELYSCVIYLSPGDYHRFHSPANWSVNFRRHFAGQLLSVKPAFVNGFPNLFSVNERVVYTGQWDYGFFSMIAVGATNVGTVRVYFDNELVTNEKHWTAGEFHDYELKEKISFSKGDSFGEFNLGSTIVLIFEAPENIEFHVKTGQKIKYGQLLCSL